MNLFITQIQFIARHFQVIFNQFTFIDVDHFFCCCCYFIQLHSKRQKTETQLNSRNTLHIKKEPTTFSMIRIEMKDWSKILMHIKKINKCYSRSCLLIAAILRINKLAMSVRFGHSVSFEHLMELSSFSSFCYSIPLSITFERYANLYPLSFSYIFFFHSLIQTVFFYLSVFVNVYCQRCRRLIMKLCFLRSCQCIHALAILLGNCVHLLSF